MYPCQVESYQIYAIYVQYEEKSKNYICKYL